MKKPTFRDLLAQMVAFENSLKTPEQIAAERQAERQEKNESIIIKRMSKAVAQAQFAGEVNQDNPLANLVILREIAEGLNFKTVDAREAVNLYIKSLRK